MTVLFIFLCVMMTLVHLMLDPIQLAFLKDVLGITPKAKNRVFPDDDQQKATTAFNKYQAHEVETLAAIKRFSDMEDVKIVKDAKIKELEKLVTDARNVAQLAKNNAKNVAQNLNAARTSLSIADNTITQTISEHNEYLNKKREHTTLVQKVQLVITRYGQMKMHDGPRLTGLQNRLDTAKVTPAAGTLAQAFVDANNRIRSIESDTNIAIRDQEVFLQQKETYETELLKAKEIRRKLMAENRSDHPTPFDAPVQKLIDDAEQLAATTAVNRFEKAVTVHLSKVETVADNQWEEVKESRKAGIEQAKDKPRYLDKVLRVQEALKKLEKVSGTTNQQKALTKMLADAKKLADQKKFGEAKDALNGLKGIMEEAKNANQEFKENGGDEAFRTLNTETKAEIDKFIKLAELALPEKTLELKTEYRQIIKDFEANPSKVGEAKNKLGLLKAKATLALQESDRKKTVADNLLKEILPLMGDLERWAPVTDYQPMFTRSVSARSLLSNQQFDDAVDELTDLKSKLTPVHGRFKTIHETWDTENAKLTQEMRDAIEEGARHSDPTILKAANPMRQNLIVDIPARLNLHDFTKATELVQGIVAGFPALDGHLKKFETVRAGLVKAREDFTKQETAVANKIDALQKLDADTSKFDARLLAAQKAWGTRQQQLLTGGKTPDALFKEVEPDLLSIITEIDVILDEAKNGDNTKIDVLKGDLVKKKEEAADAALKDDFLKLKDEAQERIDYLKEDGDPNGEAGGLQGQLTTQVNKAATAPKYLQAHVDELQKIADDIEKAIKKVTDALATKRTKAAKVIKELTAAFDTMAKEKANKSFKQCFAELKKELTIIQGMVESSVKAVVEKGEVKLAEFKTKVNKLKTPTGTDKSFAHVIEKLKELDKTLKSEKNVLKTYRPGLYATLSLRLKNEITPAVKKESPGSSMKEDGGNPDNNGVLTKFEKEVEKAMVEARAAKTKVEKINERADAIAIKIKGLEGAPSLKDNFAKRLAAARKPGERLEDQSFNELAALETLLDVDAKDSTKLALLESKAKDDEYKEEVAKKEYEGNLDVYKKNKKKADSLFKTTPETDRNDVIYNQIDENFKEAKTNAKQGNYQVASEKLATAIAAERAFIANPAGGKTTQRRNLDKVNRKWKTAVGGFMRGVKELIANVKGLPTAGVPEENLIKDAQGKLARLLKLFNASIFDDAVKTLQDPETNLATRRAVKEDSLRLMRRYKRILTTDPVIDVLPENEMGVNFKNLVGELKLRVKDWELNLLRAD